MRRLRRALGWVAIVLALLAGGGALYQAMAERRDLARFTAPGERVDIGGRKLHLLCSGKGSPTVILEASGLGTYRDWLRVQPELAKTMRVCSYDRAGLGWSDYGPLPRDARHLADDLAALIATAKLPPPYVLVGHSAGGLAVRLYAAEHPERVKGLVLVDSAPAELAKELPRVYSRMRRSARLGPPAVRLGIVRAFNPFHIDGEDRALTYRARVYDATESLVDNLPAAADQLAKAGPLPHDLPLIVLTHGKPDDWAGPGSIPADESDAVERDWQSAQLRLAALSSKGRVVVAGQSGHMIPSEQPDVVINAVREVARQPKP